MGKPKPGAPVVIVRKDKKLGPLHGAAAILTGGASLLYTAPKAASNAAYNARTRQLQDAAGQSEPPGRSSRVQEPPPPGWRPATLQEQLIGPAAGLTPAERAAAVTEARERRKAELDEIRRKADARYEAIQDETRRQLAEKRAARAERKAARRAGRHRTS